MTLQATYLGAQSMGGSTVSVTSATAYTVPITVPSGGALVAIEAAWRASTGTVGLDFVAAVFADIDGAPGQLLTASGAGSTHAIGTAARWIAKPIPPMPPGDYHIGVQFPFFATSPLLLVDTGAASDGHTVASDTNSTLADGDYSGATVTTVTSTLYSVRGVFLAETDTAITGSLSVTEADDTLAASGTRTIPPITGTLAATETADTLAASGTVTPPPITGSLAATEADDTLSASGTVTNNYTGSLTATEADDTLDAAGTVTPPTITGTLTQTETDDTLTASGTVTVPTFTGILAVTEADDTLSASGTLTNNYTGTITVTEADDTLTAQGTIPVSRWREPALTASMNTAGVGASQRTFGIATTRKEADLS